MAGPKIPDWVSSWRRNRIRGLIKHMKGELIDDPELLEEILASLHEDKEEQKVLESLGWTLKKEEKK